VLGVDFGRAGDEAGGQCNELVVFLVPFFFSFNYIKLCEVWEDILRAKANAFSSIINSLFRFGTFLTYWAIEKFLLDYDKLYAQNPNFKYVFYLSLAFGLFGLWGIVDALETYKYFQTSRQTEQLKRQAEDLEHRL